MVEICSLIQVKIQTFFIRRRIVKKSLASQLRGLNLISERTFREAEAEVEISAETGSTAHLGDLMTIADLRKSKNMQSFKKSAQLILMHDPKQIGAIIEVAHVLYRKDEGKTLFWLLINVRENLKKFPQRKEEILKKAFRKSGATAILSEEE